MTSDSASSTSPSSLWRRPFERWLDGVEPGWAIPVLLVVLVAVWTLFQVLAYQGADLHPDVLEAWTIGREFAWGNAKHPPLMGWMARAWSDVFPLTDWSFYLLAMVNAAAALLAVDLISRRFMRGDGRAIVLLLLLLLPAYQFHASRFNANSVLLATWPLATYFFLRSFETQAISWAAAAGAAAALAMLGKYYSVFLIAGFAIAAVAHPRRRAYFSSRAPWVSALAGLAVLAPHLWWLATNGTAPFQYALAVHAGLSRQEAVADAVRFVLGNAAYLVLPVFVWLLMIRADIRRFAANLGDLDSSLLLLVWIFVATVAVPPVVTIAISSNLPPLWNLQALFLAIVVMVAAAKFAVPRFDSVNLSVGVIAILLVSVAAAPFYALYRNTHPFDSSRNFISAAADEMTRRWHEATGEPFAAVSGNDDLAFGAAFYSPDHPFYKRPFRFQTDWGVPRPSTLDRGWAAMCFTKDIDCMNWMQRVAQVPQSVVRSEFTVHASLWGRYGAATKISALIVPPRAATPAPPVPSDSDDAIEDFSASRRMR
ncbi:MAG: glycosyltransferase family 39 protein [Afipia sp.]|nr:glycosyltransferase family 39 protein [Afipia sp.]